MDFEAKAGSTMLCQPLPKLGEMVMKELLAGQQAEASENLLYKAMDTYWDGSVMVDTNKGHWLIQYANESFGNMTGGPPPPPSFMATHPPCYGVLGSSLGARYTVLREFGPTGGDCGV